MNKKYLVILVIICMTAAFLYTPVTHFWKASRQDTAAAELAPKGYADDASRLNLTRIESQYPVLRKTSYAELKVLLNAASMVKLPVSIAGARHSMGGHTISPGGILLDMSQYKGMELDQQNNILRVGSGVLWSEIIEYLDAKGLSPKVMQSNNSFSVGGSISVNCHGWQYNSAPISSTVESFSIMLASGEVRECSREQNKELFSLALGGYGLFGIILEVELRVTENKCYALKQHIVPAAQALSIYDTALSENLRIEMLYARMNVSRENFLQDVIINSFSPASEQQIPPLKESGLDELRRLIFRGSALSQYGKKLRWQAETKIQPKLRESYFSRNQLLNEPVSVFENKTQETTDILHEYFIPEDRVVEFVKQMRLLIPSSKENLLNVTIRSVNKDEDTFLSYANERMFSFVLLFVQERTEEAEKRMRNLTQKLIDASLAVNGSYYLPYRLHATKEQFYRAYPRAPEFFKLKKKYDPNELFQNMFYIKYGMTGKEPH